MQKYANNWLLRLVYNSCVLKCSKKPVWPLQKTSNQIQRQMQKYKEKYTNPEICSGGTRFCGTAEASTRSGVAERQSDF